MRWIEKFQIEYVERLKKLPRSTLLWITGGSIVGLFLLVIALQGSTQSEEPSLSLQLGSVFLKLVAVVALIYLLAAFARRFKIGGTVQPGRRMVIRETLNLSPRRSLHLVQIGEQEFLIGATDQAISTLAQITKNGDTSETAMNISQGVAFTDIFRAKERQVDLQESDTPDVHPTP